MAVLKNRAKMSTSSTGTGTITLGSANTGYQSFADAGVANGDEVSYVIEDGNNWEIGLGTYTSSGTTLSRTVSESSNSGAALNLSGSATVFITAAAEDLPNLYADNPVSAAAPTASGSNAVAIGRESTASGTDSISIGSYSDATQNESTALGLFAQATGNSATALGNRSNASNSHAIAIGLNTDATAISSIAIGYAAQAVTGSGATAIGNSYASGANSFAAVITNNTSSYGATGQGATVIGNTSKGTGERTVSIGQGNIASGANATAIGYLNTSGTTSYTTAIGYNNTASAAWAMALGNDSTASHSKSVSIGDSVTSTAANQVNIGGSTQAVRISESYTLPTADGSANQVLQTDGSGALSFATVSGGGGADLYAANESSPAAQPSATGANAIAIGDSAVASDVDAFAGPLSRASGEYSVALGIGNSSSSYGAGGDQSISIGNQSRAMALQSVALGSGAYVDSDSSRGLALGENAFVQQCDYGTAIGAAARVHGGNSATEATAFGSSYASGTSSFAAAIGNNTSSYGAQNTSGIAIGSLAKAHDSGYAIAIGRNNISSGGSGCTVIGGMNNQSVATSSIITGGAYCSILGAAQYARAGGGYSKASVHGQDVFASGQFSSVGDAQGAKYILRADTTDATATVLTTNNGTPVSWNQIVAASDTCIMFSGTLVAMQNGAQDQGGWEIKGLLKNDGGTTTLVSSNIQTFDDGNGWVVALTADNTNNALAITCTGEAAHNIRWVANIQTSEVTYA